MSRWETVESGCIYLALQLPSSNQNFSCDRSPLGITCLCPFIHGRKLSLMTGSSSNRPAKEPLVFLQDLCTH